ncbi:MAG: hypothetical protein HYV07_11495 [Deltaproteobacteria bacterium]|nr:hypothetical protein [Deltaproteobacteria bacterium]
MRWVVFLVPLVACASVEERTLSLDVDESIVAVFPPEGRRWTYEAENEVVIAIDRLNSAREEVERRKKAVDVYEAAVDAASQRGSAGIAVSKARLTWLESELELAEKERDAAEEGVLCARANFELTKAKLAVRFDLPVEEGFVEPFEEQYGSCAEALNQLNADAERLGSKSVGQKDEWRKVRTEHVRRTGDYDHGLWID